MKKITKLMAVIALLGVVFGVTLTRNETIKAEAATTQTHRRIYAYTKDAWTTNAPVYIYYWDGATNNFNNADPMILLLTDYWNGFYYFDLPIAANKFLLKNAQSGDGTLKTNDISVTSLFTGTDYKVLETWGGGGSIYFQTTAGMNSGQVAAVLNHIDSCSSSYAGGFNAWAQLNDLFISSNTLDGSTLVADNFGDSTTITNKTAWLQMKNTADGGAVPGMRVFDVQNNNIYTITIIGLLSLSAIGGYYFLKTKKNI